VLSPKMKPLIFAAGFACARFLSWSAGQPPSIDAQLPSYAAAGEVREKLTVARAASTETLVDAWIQGFQRYNPRVEVRQTLKGTDQPSASLQQLIDGSVDLAPFAREIQPSEMARARERIGTEPLGIAVASGSYDTPSNTHAIAIYVNTANPLSQLTLTELDAIYSSTRLRRAPVDLTTWGQLGLTGEWAHRSIHRYGMVINRKTGNPHAGIVAYLMERLMLGGEFKPDTRQVPDTGMGRGNNRALDEIAQAVASDPDGIGYAGFANRLPGIKTLALAENASSAYYAGTPEDVASRRYPLTRTIFIFVRRPPSPAVREFLRYALSREGQEAIAADSAHFLPLPAAFAERERAKLATAAVQ